MSIFRGGALTPRVYGLPPGGDAYAVLAKQTGDDFDVVWTDSPTFQLVNIGGVSTQIIGDGFAFLSGTVTVDGGTVWHSNNDGAGSGLDADLLDGQQGTYYRAWSNLTSVPAAISAVAALTPAADRLPYYTSGSAAALATFTAAGRALVDDADAAAQRTTLGLGAMATWAANAAAITGGFANFNQACSVSTTGASLYVDNTSASYSGDIVQILGNNSTSLAYFAIRVYNNIGSPVGGLRGDGSLITTGYAAATHYVENRINKGTVGASTTITWAAGSYQTLTLTSATNLTLTFGAPSGPAKLYLAITSPPSGTNPSITYPATVKGSPPTSVTALARYMVLEFFYDGTNYIYLAGLNNIS